MLAWSSTKPIWSLSLWWDSDEFWSALFNVCSCRKREKGKGIWYLERNQVVVVRRSLAFGRSHAMPRQTGIEHGRAGNRRARWWVHGRSDRDRELLYHRTPRGEEKKTYCLHQQTSQSVVCAVKHWKWRSIDIPRLSCDCFDSGTLHGSMANPSHLAIG